MKNKYNFGVLEPRKVILLYNSIFLSMIYSLVHLKYAQRSQDLKSNMAATQNGENETQA